MEERKHILKILQNTKSALKNKDHTKIKNLSNQIVHTASIHQDPDVISLAVIIYALSKIIERQNYQEEENWNIFYKGYTKNIDDMIRSLKKDNLKRFHQEIKENRQLIQRLSGNLKTYIQDVFKDAKINKASRIYEHGISMEKTAKILGVSLWELSEYTGKTGIHNVNLAVTIPIKKRIKFAEEIFK